MHICIHKDSCCYFSLTHIRTRMCTYLRINNVRHFDSSLSHSRLCIQINMASHCCSLSLTHTLRCVYAYVYTGCVAVIPLSLTHIQAYAHKHKFNIHTYTQGGLLLFLFHTFAHTHVRTCIHSSHSQIHSNVHIHTYTQGELL